MNLSKVTREHSIKMSVSLSVSVEDCSLAVDQSVGHSSVKSTAQMNGAVVIFVDKVEKANTVVERHYGE